MGGKGNLANQSSRMKNISFAMKGTNFVEINEFVFFVRMDCSQLGISALLNEEV